MARTPGVTLIAAVAALAERYAPPKPLTDPLEMILWENMGYLIDDDRRTLLFAEFTERVGLDAVKIDRAPLDVLLDIAKRGGMRPETRVERWHAISRIVIEDAGGDLAKTLKALPLPKARTLLKRFPVIGDPGADKILLFSGLDVRPALDSNGLRVMLRLEFAEMGKSYGASYRNAVGALAADGEVTLQWLTRAYLVLQAHGRALCKRASPNCAACLLDARCAHFMVEGY
jgi:endonuclease-3